MELRKTIAKKKNVWEVLSYGCLSSKHRADIPKISTGACQCGNCKISVRGHWHTKGAYGGDFSWHDYVLDVEEVIKLKTSILKEGELPLRFTARDT